ncbi:MAG: hypothetical protein K6F92_00010 [Lachnospiraceae bacterium]|nr:hypothetical protein [Lachnospiraceae bacterium]
MFGIFDSDKKKYAVTADCGYNFNKKMYAPGENVEVVYGLVPTDTDHYFYADSPDVLVKTSYEDRKGYVVSFTMPEHDVKLLVSKRNSMVCDSKVEKPDIEDCYKKAKLIFNYYETTLATESGGESTEYAIYDYGDYSTHIFAWFYKTDEGDEKYELSWVPNLLYRTCLGLVEKYDMRHWKDETSLEGGRYVVRIAYGQEILRFSSDSMAKNGMEAFSEISKYISKIGATYKKMKD